MFDASSVRVPLVSVVLVNFRGVDDTMAAIEGLRTLQWPVDRLEIVVVENGSGDVSADRLRALLPDIVLVESAQNLGFAGGCNLGVAHASGDIVAFLNSDARPDAQWIAAAMVGFSDPAVGAVASRVLDWKGELVDFVDAGLTWFGKGYKPFVGDRAGTLGLSTKDVLFGTGSAMFVRRSVFDELGGFDERFFMFYEDVDLGWRLNLLGHRFRYVPESIAYHRHHATAERFGRFREAYFLERNALFCLYKNLADDNLNRVLPAALALTVRRGVAAGNLDSDEFDYRATTTDDGELEQVVAREALASMYAVDQLVEHLDALTVARSHIQLTRKVTDRAIGSLMGRRDVIPAVADSYAAGYTALVEAFPVTEPFDATHILVITGDPLGAKMAGPAIRAWNMALALSSEHEVVLLSTSGHDGIEAPFRIETVRAGDERAFSPWADWADVIVFQGHAMAQFETLASSTAVIVADVYDPMHLEQLEQGRELHADTWDRHVADATDVLNQQLERADFALCASERQRTFYLGQLAALGRINPANYIDDPELRGLIDVSPFGIDAVAPRHERAVLKGVVPGIGHDDKVILWGGGLYNWFDPATLIRAVALLSERRPTVRLFFQGTKHPHPDVPEMRVVADSRTLAAELGALGTSVFFNDSWVDFVDRQNYLMEADAGVSTHFSHIETTFSFRTRILDYLWAGLPMVVTEGDSFAELIEAEGLGFVVPERDHVALAAALDAALFDDDLAAAARERVAAVRERFVWSATLAPLLAFARAPRHAPDIAEQLGRTGAARRATPKRRRGWRRDLDLVRHYWRTAGPRVVIRKAVRRVFRRS